MAKSHVSHAPSLWCWYKKEELHCGQRQAKSLPMQQGPATPTLPHKTASTHRLEKKSWDSLTSWLQAGDHLIPHVDIPLISASQPVGLVTLPGTW